MKNERREKKLRNEENLNQLKKIIDSINSNWIRTKYRKKFSIWRVKIGEYDFKEHGRENRGRGQGSGGIWSLKRRNNLWE